MSRLMAVTVQASRSSSVTTYQPDPIKHSNPFVSETAESTGWGRGGTRVAGALVSARAVAVAVASRGRSLSSNADTSPAAVSAELAAGA